MMRKKHRPAFTLIELLIVVAIIGILAAIAVPNFMNARLKARIARVQSEFNSISTAFRMYLLDSNSHMPRWTKLGWPDAWRRFTSPVAYMTLIPLDIFQPKPGVGEQVHNHLWYEYSGCLGRAPLSGPRSGGKVDNFVLASIGPDADDDTDLISDYPYSGKFMPFDLTNGMRSDGDVLYESSPGLNAIRGW